ncbi:MAG: endonuclease/exonuclease/phosphatase family protein [Alphaproteobacteria bacterium]|nr:endonuclease/exonuclease/phosphatase family protein [Alphaproteobacteria bacterium]
MKIAAFNVENLFDRARAFNEGSAMATQAILEATSELNGLFEKPNYTVADKSRMVKLLKTLDLGKSDTGDFVILRRIRGRIVRRPRDGSPIEIVAAGRDDWIGWVELRMAPVNEIAILNTGRVIRDVAADILAVVEAENRVALKQFSDIILKEVEGQPYDQVMVIDGNDDRGIDVGIMTRPGYQVGFMRSHIHDRKPDGAPIFSRDCPEYAITTPTGERIWVLPNHFKSKFGGDIPGSRAKREAQARRVAEIYNALVDQGHDRVVVLGDLNDTPDSPPLQPLLAETDLMDVAEHPAFTPGEFAGKGTFGLGNDNQKIDYLLLSPSLFGRVTSAGLFRMGAWPGKQPERWTVYPELTSEVHVASDHHVIWAVIEDP